MGRVFALFPWPHRGDLYKYSGPTMGHLQHFFLKKDKCPTNARGGGGGGFALLELTEP